MASRARCLRSHAPAQRLPIEHERAWAANQQLRTRMATLRERLSEYARALSQAVRVPELTSTPCQTTRWPGDPRYVLEGQFWAVTRPAAARPSERGPQSGTRSPRGAARVQIRERGGTSRAGRGGER
jgi:hypothetical protein